jgi:LacI family transcriptional regulator
MTTIGVISQSPDNQYSVRVIAGIREIAERSGYDVTKIENLDYRAYPVQGIIAIAHEAPDEVLWQIHNDSIPLSLISHQVPDLPVPCVIPNNALGIARLVEHLVVERKRTRPVFLGGLENQVDAIQREQAFRAELMRYNITLPETYFLRGDFESDIAAEAVNNFLSRKEPFDALIAADHIMGLSALQVLRKAGVSVPKQVSVVAFDDNDEAAKAGLTTVAGELAAMGRCGANQLLAAINGIEVLGVTTLGLKLIVRKTS